MPEIHQTTPRWIVAQIGDDFNWWVDQSSEELGMPRPQRGLLDPKQVAYMTRALDAYRPYDFNPKDVATAFQMYRIESELDDQRVRLVSCDDSIYNTSENLFALPIEGEGGAGPYSDLLDMVSAAHIRLLNRTHDYVQDCTEEEMSQELNAIDADRFFSDQSLHPFEEISEILQWRPAEWDDSES